MRLRHLKSLLPLFVTSPATQLHLIIPFDISRSLISLNISFFHEVRENFTQALPVLWEGLCEISMHERPVVVRFANFFAIAWQFHFTFHLIFPAPHLIEYFLFSWWSAVVIWLIDWCRRQFGTSTYSSLGRPMRDFVARKVRRRCLITFFDSFILPFVWYFWSLISLNVSVFSKIRLNCFWTFVNNSVNFWKLAILF